MIFLILLLMNTAQAATILIEAPTARDLDYQATLRAHPDYQSPTRAYLAAHPSSGHREQLLKALTSAQKSFLQNSTTEARAGFMGVLGLLHEDDWGREEREVFLLAYFRLAQLESESDPGARDRWLAESLLLGPGLNADEALIPPPLVTRRRELSEQVPAGPINPSKLAAGWNEVLINGQRCMRRDCENWTRYPGKVRVTFLSDRWLPQTTITDAQEISSLNPKTIAWAEGSCASPHPHAQAKELAANRVFWDLECDRPKTVEENFKPVAQAVPGAVPAITFEAKPTPILKSKWFWAGVGIVAAVLIVRGSQKHESRETTTSYN